MIADTGERGARYRLLETTRVYALEKLAEVGETQVCGRRHAVHFRKLVHQALGDWLSMPDLEWTEAYTLELDNVRVAMDWAFGPDGDPALGIALAAGSGPLWSSSGLFSEGRRRLQAALAAVGPETPQSDHAHLWYGLGFLKKQMPAER